MIKKKFQIMFAAILILISIILPGCSKSTEPDVVRTDNVNKPPTASNNTNVPANNSVSASPTNTPTSVVNNNPAVNVNKDKKPSPPVKEPTPQIGSGGSDFVLFTQVRGSLASDQELSNAVIIEIKEGNVTLTGNVSSQAQKTKAAQLVQGVNGVKSVKNNLRVSS